MNHHLTNYRGSLQQWADTHNTSIEIAIAIHEQAAKYEHLAKMADVESIWQDADDREIRDIIVRAWDLADDDEEELHWGSDSYEIPFGTTYWLNGKSYIDISQFGPQPDNRGTNGDIAYYQAVYRRGELALDGDYCESVTMVWYTTEEWDNHKCWDDDDYNKYCQCGYKNDESSACDWNNPAEIL